MTQAVGHIAPIPAKSHLTRRAALTGMALIAAPSTALAVCISPDGDDPLLQLWERRRELRRLQAACSAGYRAAMDALPEWADSGHEYIRKSDGEGFGCNVGWPALETPLDAGDHFIVRPFPAEIKHWAKDRPRADYRAAMRDFIGRRREQERVNADLGIPALGNESEALVEEISVVEEDIVRIADNSPDLQAAAVHCIIALSYAWTGGKGFLAFEEGASTLSALRALRPHLRGTLADDADEVLGRHRINFHQDDDDDETIEA